MRMLVSAPLQRTWSTRLRHWLVVVVLAGVATGIDLLIARVATPLVHAPADYPSFTWLPLLAGALLGALGGYGCLLLLTRFVSQSTVWFVRIAAGVLVLSYGLPILPIIHPLPRFAGVNWGIALTLMVIHTVTAAIIVAGFLRWIPMAPRASRAVPKLNIGAPVS